MLDPVFGSVSPVQALSRPPIRGFRYFSFCAGVPCAARRLMEPLVMFTMVRNDSQW